MFILVSSLRLSSSSSKREFYKRFFFKALLRLRRLVPLFLNWMADRMWQTVKKKVEEKNIRQILLVVLTDITVGCNKHSWWDRKEKYCYVPQCRENYIFSEIGETWKNGRAYIRILQKWYYSKKKKKLTELSWLTASSLEAKGCNLNSGLKGCCWPLCNDDVIGWSLKVAGGWGKGMEASKRPSVSDDVMGAVSTTSSKRTDLGNVWSCCLQEKNVIR